MKEEKKSQKENKKEADDKKKCFIIMPITTPDPLMEKYSGGKDHFAHVLDQIFIPAIENSNLDPIPPKVTGSGVIQADIIKNLETADLVLCDISTLNPNVFFEFGIRTALNKPVSLVMDDKTLKIPFDPSIIHHHKYNSALQSWTHEEDVNKLSDHINESLEKSSGKNALWKYFGLSSAAHPAEEIGGVEGQLSYLTMVVESLKEKFESGQRATKPWISQSELMEIVESSFDSSFKQEELIKKLRKEAKKQGLKILSCWDDPKSKILNIEIEGKLSDNAERNLKTIALAEGSPLRIREVVKEK